MNKKFVVTRPNHDPTTNYLYHWSKPLIAYAQKKGFNVVDLSGDKANRKRFEGVVSKIKPALIVLNGHGNNDTVSGYDNEPLVQVGVNENVLEGSITYALSCRSGKHLGKKAVKAGAKAYIGYDDDFIFIIDEQKITRPLEDKTAALFFEPSSMVVISLLKGNTTSVSCKRSKDIFRANIRKLLTSESPQLEKDSLPYLNWNMNHQVCLGDQEARV